MDCSNIVRVVDVSGSDYVNEYLATGWVLLGVAPGQNPEDHMAYMLYSLGWPSEKGDVKEPKNPYWN